MWQVGKTPRRNMAAVRLPLIRGMAIVPMQLRHPRSSAQVKAPCHEAVFRTDAERLQNRLFDGRGNGDAKLGGAFERIAVNPFDGIRRKNSGDAAVKRCTHG